MISAALLVSTSVAEVQIERVFGPEIKTGDYKHPSCFTQLGNGDLYLAYYGGAGEYEDGKYLGLSPIPKGDNEGARKHFRDVEEGDTQPYSPNVETQLSEFRTTHQQ